jgi:hypothetical protein
MTNNSVEAQDPDDDNEFIEVDTGEDEVEYSLAPDEDDTLSDVQDTEDEDVE